MNKRRIFLAIVFLIVWLSGCGNTYSAEGDISINESKQVGQTAVQVDPAVDVSVKSKDNGLNSSTNDITTDATVQNMLT